MDTPTPATTVDSDLYERDEIAWLEAQAFALREGRVRDLDLDHLAEFLGDMAGSQRNDLTSRLEVLLAHRIKIERQPERYTLSWSLTIDEQHARIEDALEVSPSLRQYVPVALAKAYPRALKSAAKETRIPLRTLRATMGETCPWSFAELMAYEPPEIPER